MSDYYYDPADYGPEVDDDTDDAPAVIASMFDDPEADPEEGANVRDGLGYERGNRRKYGTPPPAPSHARPWATRAEAAARAAHPTAAPVVAAA